MPTSLTKNDIIGTLAAYFEYSRDHASDIVETLIELMKHSLESGDDVLISGFGKFCVKEKNARRGRNPDTGEPMMLNPRRVVTFKCSGKLRDALNQTRP